MFRNIFLILTLSFFILVSCSDNGKPESGKEIVADSTATDNFDELMEDTDSGALPETGGVINTDTVKPQPDAVEKPEIKESTADYTKKPLVGVVVSLDAVIKGDNTKINKQQAKEIAEKGGILAVKAGEQIYFVYFDDGTFGSKRLAGFAVYNKIGMIGKAKVVDGMNIFIASLIEEM